MAISRVQTVAQAEKESRRQMLIVVILSAVCLVGFSYIVYDYIQITNRISLPAKLSEVDSAVRQLEASGLIISLNIPQTQLTVSEEQWYNLAYEEKVGLITQLARYCANKNKTREWVLTVLGNASRAKLGEIGTTGLTVN